MMGGKDQMREDSYFAPAERARDDELQHQVEIASQNPIVDALMKAISGLVAVLNEQRQILCINDTLLETLGIQDAYEVLGLRLGEAINCIHAREHPGGCGTSRFCATCGAAIAIVTSLANDRAEERECVATIERAGQQVDLYFRVRCCPITLEKERFLLLFLQDITTQQRRAALERVFFHDINNIIGALKINSHLLVHQGERGTRSIGERIKKLTSRLAKEVEIQKALSYEGLSDYQLTLEEVSSGEILQEIQETFANHPAARTKHLHLPESLVDGRLTTDVSLLLRILTNMLVNAFEATAKGGEVKLWLEQTEETTTFCVWNNQAIPDDVASRVFQRNFSTKQGAGRGLGTYAIKLFGETYLKGKVDFTTSEKNGTVFRLCLPQKLLSENQHHYARPNVTQLREPQAPEHADPR
jgi:signal transduction histidine kinase